MWRIIPAIIMVIFNFPFSENGQVLSIEQLTFDDYQNGYADWSPDGEYIIYTMDMDTSDTEDGDLWRISYLGGKAKQLTFDGGHHGAYSPDGKYIAFDSEEGSVIQIISGEGGQAIRIVPEEIPIEHSGNPCWSPDGKKIAFRSGEKLYSLELATGEITLIFDGGDLKPMPIQWYSHENCILVSLLDVVNRKADLWKIDIKTGEETRLTDLDSYISQATLSPLEQLIVFSSPHGVNNDLWVMMASGSDPVRLTYDEGYDLEPCFSPDGKKIVFTSTRSKKVELYIMEIDPDKVLDNWVW